MAGIQECVGGGDDLPGGGGHEAFAEDFLGRKAGAVPARPKFVFIAGEGAGEGGAVAEQNVGGIGRGQT